MPTDPDSGELVMAKGNNNKLWVPIIEKVWASRYGNYL